MAEEPKGPTEEALREALARVRVSDVLLQTATSVSSLGFHRLTPEARDLEQARQAIEALGALVPLLEGAVDDALVRDLRAAGDSLKLAYARAVSETAPDGG